MCSAFFHTTADHHSSNMPYGSEPGQHVGNSHAMLHITPQKQTTQQQATTQQHTISAAACALNLNG
jgi:hypothetical protein